MTSPHLFPDARPSTDSRPPVALQSVRPGTDTPPALPPEHAELLRVCDTLGLAALALDLWGNLLQRTDALLMMLASEPEAPALLAAAERMGQSLVEPMIPPRSPLVQGTQEIVQTERGPYLVRGCVHSPPRGGGSPLVLVSLERLPPRQRTRAELCQLYALTGTEVEVALLLALGRSNAEIAEARGISPHTARRHTERVLHKLGVRSRAEIARRLTE